jgi:hypothetical protein
MTLELPINPSISEEAEGEGFWEGRQEARATLPIQVPMARPLLHFAASSARFSSLSLSPPFLRSYGLLSAHALSPRLPFVLRLIPHRSPRAFLATQLILKLSLPLSSCCSSDLLTLRSLILDCMPLAPPPLHLYLSRNPNRPPSPFFQSLGEGGRLGRRIRSARSGASGGGAKGRGKTRFRALKVTDALSEQAVRRMSNPVRHVTRPPDRHAT